MDSRHGSRAPFEDLSNTANPGTRHDGQAVDPNELKRQRERARYATMSDEQKNNKRLRHRGLSMMNKGQTFTNENVSPEERNDGSDNILGHAAGFRGSLQPDDNIDWLHRNDLYQPHHVDNYIPDNSQTEDLAFVTPHTSAGSQNASIAVSPNQRRRESARARRAAISAEQRAVINQRRRDAYHAKKEKRPSLSEKERQENRRQGRRETKRRLKQFQTNNLHHESITIDNPHFIPKLVFPSEDASKISPHDWSISEYNGSPVYIQSTGEHSPKIDNSTMSADHATQRPTQRRRVSPGERNTLIARRNRQFE